MATDTIDKASIDDRELELQTLRNQVVAQSRELAVLRWELSALARRHPVSGQVTRLKTSVLKRFPQQIVHVRRLRRFLRERVASALPRRQQRLRASPMTGAAPLDLRGPILMIGDSSIAERIAGTVAARDVVQLEQGAGFTRSLPVPMANQPALRAPEEGTFVKWLIDNGHRLKTFKTIVVEAADGLSLGLLRGRLGPDQTLVLGIGRDASLASPQVAELGEPDMRDASTASYSKFPATWLDVLDEHDRPIAARVNERTWPKISVVMVSFNQAAFLEEGLDSVLGQGYQNLEFIVIDGNSTDGSVAILERYRDRLSQLLIEPDDGQSDGLNKGFARATGDILTWVNSDDLLEPGALFRVAQAFTMPGVDMVAGGCRQIGLGRDTIILNHHNRLPFGIQTALPLGLLLEMDRFWLTGSFFYQPEVFFSHAIWQRSGGKLRTDLNYVLDYDLWVRMAAAGAHIVHIPEFLACSRTHDQQKTDLRGMSFLPEVNRLLLEYSSRLVSPP